MFVKGIFASLLLISATAMAEENVPEYREKIGNMLDNPAYTRSIQHKSNIPLPPKKPLFNLPEKRLHLKSIHTGEEIHVAFWRSGAYLQSGLTQLNKFLRDHRTGDVTKMDPELFALVHRVYEKSGSHKPIEIISGFRSIKTNDMLRAQGRNVAKNSQHVQGKAMDIRITDVPLKKQRDIALEMGVGGVGFYSASRFIHVDTGRPRRW